MVIWVDQNIYHSIKRVGKTVLDLFSDSQVRLITLNSIRDVKKFFKHLFMIRYKQRTEKHLRKYCIIIFNDFRKMNDILEFKEVIEYFKDTDLSVMTSIFSTNIDKTSLSLIRKVDSHTSIIDRPAVLFEYIRDPDTVKDKGQSHSDFNDSHNDHSMMVD